MLSLRAVPRYRFLLLGALLPLVLLGAAPATGADDGAAQGYALASLREPEPRLPDRLAEPTALSGRVTLGRSPLAAVRVYAYQMADLTLDRVSTDRLGNFVFRSLPAGLYKVIAHKPGFIPAVVLVTRATAESYQFLDLELAAEESSETPERDFWTVRSRIPSDVLRDIQLAELEIGTEPVDAPRFSTELSALHGVEDLPLLGSSQLTDGRVGLQTQVGGVELGLQGRLKRLEPSLGTLEGASGLASSVSLNIAPSSTALVNVSGLSNYLDTRALDPRTQPVELEHYGVSWKQDFGSGESSVAARYTSESNFYRDRRFTPLGVPDASTTWTVEGSYDTHTSEQSTLLTGISFRQRQVAVGLDPRLAPSERIDVFGLGDFALHPAVVLQYGLFTTLSDGSFAFSPHAGVVLELGESWRAEAAGRQRLEGRPLELVPYFTPAYLSDVSECGVAEEHCYTLRVVRELGDSQEVSLGVLHRQFSETLRLYFSEDFFDQLESLFLVPGDDLPEVQFAVSHQLGKNVLTRFESNLAAGGGGVFVAANGARLENEVGYLMTSLDTQIEPTSTGVLVSFHRLEQSLYAHDTLEQVGPQLDVDRLQVLLTQSLGPLLGIARDWALSLDMQLSRGAIPYAAFADPDEVRRSVVGGIALRF